jgi:glycosyltransferase involved in cell wall biosynthesis
MRSARLHAKPRAPGVLHLVDCLRMGGTERQLLGLLRQLDRRRFPQAIACFQRDGELLPELERLGLNPVELPLKGTLYRANTAVQVARLAALCRARGVAILHAHDFYANAIAVAVGRLTGLKVIVSRRDLGHWLGAVQRRVLPTLCRWADRVLCNASAVARLAIAEQVPAAKVSVIYNGIDVADFDRAAARPPSPPPPRIRRPPVPAVLMVGSMNLPDKGHGDLLGCAARLAARGRTIEWWLASDGPLRRQWEERSRALGLQGAVRFLGRRDDVPALLAAADLVVHPSWAEGFPNVVLEAMCAGRPVIATRVGGAPELVLHGTTGVLVEPRRPVELADAVERLILDPPLQTRMGRLGRRHVETRFTIERTRVKTEALYESLLP